MKLIAHRGANKAAPQNTLSAFRLARQMSADGFETDVHLTKDGRVVLCHNADIDATSNGKGYINDLTYEELRSYDFGSYFSKDFEGEKIPELSEFLSIAAGLEIINIEVKTPYNHDYTVVDKTLNMVAEFGLTRSLLISSFDPVVLRRVRDLDPSVQTGLLYDFTKKMYRQIRKDPVRFASELGCTALHPIKYLTDRALVARAHEVGMAVNVWTVDDDRYAKLLHRIDADALITDVPDRLAAYGDAHDPTPILQQETV